MEDYEKWFRDNYNYFLRDWLIKRRYVKVPAEGDGSIYQRFVTIKNFHGSKEVPYPRYMDYRGMYWEHEAEILRHSVFSIGDVVSGFMSGFLQQTGRLPDRHDDVVIDIKGKFLFYTCTFYLTGMGEAWYEMKLESECKLTVMGRI